MARPLRIEYAGAIYHVTSCGDRREAIYLDEKEDLMGDPPVSYTHLTLPTIYSV